MTFGETFLTYPELFPARLAGESAGAISVTAELAGESFQIDDLSRLQAELLEQWLGRLGCLDRHRSRGEGATIKIFRAPAGEFREVAALEPEERFDFAFSKHAVGLAGRNCMARLELAPDPRGAIWTSLVESTHFRGLFENFFRVLLAYRVLSRGGLLLHSSGVVVRDRAHIFFGQSGAGKTTVARMGLERGHRVLSDDLNAILLKEGQLLVCRVPFFGDLRPSEGLAGWYPLGGVYRLKRGDANQLRPMGRARAVAEALTCASFLNQDPYRRDLLMERLTSLFGQLAAQELTFSLDGDFWDLLEKNNA